MGKLKKAVLGEVLSYKWWRYLFDRCIECSNCKNNRKIHRLFTAFIFTTFSVSFLSMVSVDKAFGNEAKDKEIKEYAEKLTKFNEYHKAVIDFEHKKGLEVFPILIRGLKDEDTFVRVSSAYRLGRIGNSSIASLSVSRGTNLKKLRLEAKHSKALYNAVVALTQALTDKKALVRHNAARALQNLAIVLPQTEAAPAISQAVTPLIKALKDNDSKVRASAAYTLEMIPRKAAVPPLIEALKDKDAQVRSNAARALGNIGEKVAIPVLLEALKDNNDEVRQSVVSSLGSGRFEEKVAVDIFFKALKDKNEGVRTIAANGLGSISENYQDNASKFSNQDLNKAISTLEKALKIIDNPKANFEDYQKAALKRSLYTLKKEKESRFISRTLEWITRNPWITGAIIYTIFFPSLWLTIFYLRPLWLIKTHRALNPLATFKLPDLLGSGNLPIQTLLLLEPFAYRPRVLDAWVASHIEAAKEGFNKKKTVGNRTHHIPLPVTLDNTTIANFTGKELQPIFDKKRATVLIHGEGGAGKTSLACQLGRLVMSDDATLRPSKHQMLPILIEQEFDFDVASTKQPLTEIICGQLQALINEAETIPPKLLERLLRQRRILVIIDHLSEMNEDTRNQIRPGDADFLANALIVTSRLDEILDNVPKTTVKPLRVSGNQLSSFMEAYLTQRGKRNLFNDAEYFQACGRLSLMVGRRNITVLLAKLYAEQMIFHVETLYDASLKNLPDNIPNLMLAYLNELNRNAEDKEPDNRTVQRDAKVIAYSCLNQNFRPTAASLNEVLKVLDKNDAEERLIYLEKDLHLIKTMTPAQDKIKFELDPLAEYLAGLYLIDCCKDDAKLWREFLKKAESINDIKAIKGFLLAVQDCCLAKGVEAQVPNFVVEELAKIIGLTLNSQKSTIINAHQ